MLNETPAEPRRTVERLAKQPPTVPSISLPKGGGAIRAMGEKLADGAVTGTGSMTVPIATLPGRSGFGPRLKLAFDSASGKVRKVSARAGLCKLVGFNVLRGHSLTRCRLSPALLPICASGADFLRHLDEVLSGSTLGLDDPFRTARNPFTSKFAGPGMAREARFALMRTHPISEDSSRITQIPALSTPLRGRRARISTAIPAALLTLGCCLFSSCTSPQALRPVAQDNADNIRALVANNKRISVAYADSLAAQRRALKSIKLTAVSKAADELAAGVSSGQDDKTKRDVVRKALQERTQNIKAASLALSKEQLAMAKPLVGDVAAGLLTEDEAIDICLNTKRVIDLRPDPQTLYTLLEPQFKNVCLIKSFDAGFDALLRAYNSYVAQIDAQSELATKHAAAILEFSEAKTDLWKVFSGTAQDKQLQDSVLSLIKDPKDKATAQSVWEEFNKLNSGEVQSSAKP